MKRYVRFCLITVLLLELMGCASAQPESSPQLPSVTVSILPQEYFVNRIAGERVEVNVMVQPGASPATYEPRADQLVALADADAYFRIGVAYEDVWMDRITAANPQMTVIDTTAGIERHPIEAHAHEGEDEHEEDELLDPHVWLSPELVKIQAANIRDALVTLDPQGQQIYDANLVDFMADIEQLQQEMGDELAGVENRKFLVFHPSWGYLADEFDLEMVAIEVGGQEPSAQELKLIIDEALEENIRVVFAQPEFSIQAAETIASQIDGDVVLISPLAYDWLANLKEVSSVLSDAMQSSGSHD